LNGLKNGKDSVGSCHNKNTDANWRARSAHF